MLGSAECAFGGTLGGGGGADSTHPAGLVRGGGPRRPLTSSVDMRKQYHLRPSASGLLAWDVDRLIALTADLVPMLVPLDAIRELDEPFWFGAGSAPATCRAVADHARLIIEADTRHPIILGADGRVMDGMHRVAKAYLERRGAILAVQLDVDPEPDFVGVDEDALPYEDGP
jgi:hypothetical protein